MKAEKIVRIMHRLCINDNKSISKICEIACVSDSYLYRVARGINIPSIDFVERVLNTTGYELCIRKIKDADQN